MTQICLRYVSSLEKWDDLNIYKGQSNISVSPALQPNNHPDIVSARIEYPGKSELCNAENTKGKQYKYDSQGPGQPIALLLFFVAVRTTLLVTWNSKPC